MKKIYLLCFVVMCFAACTSEEPEILSPDDKTDMEISSLYRSENEVIEIAQNALNLLNDEDEAMSRTSSTRRHIDPESAILTIKSTPHSRAGECDDLMYIVNYADNMGFAIVSANKNAPDLLAVTEKGHYEPENPGDNESFNFYMDMLTESLSSLNSIGTKPSPNPDFPFKPVTKYKTVKDTVYQIIVPNRVRLNWGQRIPEGRFAKNQIAGCVPVAAAMCMTYFKQPAQIHLTYESGKPLVSINWDAIASHKHLYNRYYCNYPDSAHLDISRLCREIGQRAKSDYSKPSATSTTVGNLKSALEDFGYTVSKHDKVSIYKLAETLNKDKCILLMIGTNPKTDDSHMWVCDAAKSYDVRTKNYENYGLIVDNPKDELDGWTFIDETIQTYSYAFFNWGWYGDKNGYFVSLDITDEIINFTKGMNYLKVTR